jgi:hypothetical protein
MEPSFLDEDSMHSDAWIPAFAGMTTCLVIPVNAGMTAPLVIPANAGIHDR